MEADETDTPETTGLMTETAIPALDADDGKTVAVEVVDDSAGVLTPEQAKQGVLDMLDDSIGELWQANRDLTTQVQQQAEIINRMFTVLLAASTMPEQSSFSRAFADRCGAILTGRQHVNASVV